MKLKLTGLVVRDVEQTKRKYLQLNNTVSTHTTATVTIITTATKAQATTIYFIATATSSKNKDIKAKIFEYTETVCN